MSGVRLEWGRLSAPVLEQVRGCGDAVRLRGQRHGRQQHACGADEQVLQVQLRGRQFVRGRKGVREGAGGLRRRRGRHQAVRGVQGRKHRHGVRPAAAVRDVWVSRAGFGTVEGGILHDGGRRVHSEGAVRPGPRGQRLAGRRGDGRQRHVHVNHERRVAIIKKI